MISDSHKAISDVVLKYTEGFFEEINDIATARNFVRGQIVKTIPVYPISIGSIYALEVTQGHPHDDFHLHRFRLSEIQNIKDLDQLKRIRPLKNIQLAHDEHLIVMKSKIRRAVFWNQIDVSWSDGITRKYALVIPIFGLDRAEDKFIKKVACFDFPERFFIPYCRNLTSIICEAHFDKIQIIPIRFIKPQKGSDTNIHGMVINEITMWIFSEHFYSFWNPDNVPFDLRKEQREFIESRIVIE